MTSTTASRRPGSDPGNGFSGEAVEEEQGDEHGHLGEVMKILIATDIHLGYAEKDPVRAEDSFVTFDEILELGLEHDVDMVLLGGDLFHDNKPSRQAHMKCVQILRNRVLGDRPIEIELVSDPKDNFGHCCEGRRDVNYRDPNLNVALPVFSVHGNHDDPSGLGGFSVLDDLHTTGLLNYFGKVDNLKEINVSPLLITKGSSGEGSGALSKLALYGLSSVKDERLHRLFREGKVQMLRPAEDTEEWFNLLVLHQNRAKHGGPTNYIPEHFIEGFVDLVLWGHEHECRLTPEAAVFGEDKVFHITQPGSSVATSLCEGEAIPKRVGLLEVQGRRFKLEEVPLQTVRPLIFRTVSVEDLVPDFKPSISSNRGRGGFDPKKAIEDALVKYVEDLLRTQVPPLLTGHPSQPTLPLVRVRVEYDDEAHQLAAGRFGNNFHDRVANPSDILLFKKRPLQRSLKGGADGSAFTKEELEQMEGLLDGASGTTSMEDLISTFFENGNNGLKLLGVKGIGAAVKRFIDKDDRDAIALIVDKQLKKVLDVMGDLDVEDDQVDEELDRIRVAREGASTSAKGVKGQNLEAQEADAILDASDRELGRRAVGSEVLEDMDLGDEDEVPPPTKASRGGRGRGSRGRAGSAAARGTLGRGRGRGSAASRTVPESDDDENQSDDQADAKRVRPSAAARSRAALGTLGAATNSRANSKASNSTTAISSSSNRKKPVVASQQTSIMSAFARQAKASSSSMSSNPRSTGKKNVVYDSDSDY